MVYHWCDRRIFAYRRPLRHWGFEQMQSGGNLVLRRWCVCPRVIAARNSSCRVVYMAKESVQQSKQTEPEVFQWP